MSHLIKERNHVWILRWYPRTSSYLTWQQVENLLQGNMGKPHMELCGTVFGKPIVEHMVMGTNQYNWFLILKQYRRNLQFRHHFCISMPLSWFLTPSTRHYTQKWCTARPLQEIVEIPVPRTPFFTSWYTKNNCCSHWCPFCIFLYLLLTGWVLKQA